MFEVTTIYNSIKTIIPIGNFKKKIIDGEFLVITNNNLVIYYLNETAKDFYILIDGCNTVEDIINKLSKLYDVEFDMIVNDIINLIRDLEWKQLLILK